MFTRDILAIIYGIKVTRKKKLVLGERNFYEPLLFLFLEEREREKRNEFTRIPGGKKEKGRNYTRRANRASLIRAHSPVQKLFEGEPPSPPTKARRLRLLERRDSKRGVGGRRSAAATGRPYARSAECDAMDEGWRRETRLNSHPHSPPPPVFALSATYTRRRIEK